MRAMTRGVALIVCVLASVTPLWAQGTEGGSITGVVHDPSGAVLPGVTVEAASDVLIERTRTAVTDGNGQYRIINLRPGRYTVSFALGGFNSYKREELELFGTSTVTVDAEMRVGAVQETITVRGNTPIVDLQNTNRERVMSADLIASLPTSRMYYTLGVLVPGVNSSSRDVGGSGGAQLATLTAHGGSASDQRITQNGMNLAGLRAGNVTQVVANTSAMQEVVIDVSGFGADRQTGGVQINFIPRDGGNKLTGSVFVSGVGEGQQSNNFTQEIIDLGMVRPNKFKKNWDINPSVGGPLLRDRLWYYVTYRHFGTQVNADAFYNANEFQPNVWEYVADRSRPALARNGKWQDGQGRLTWQMNGRNKLAGTISNQVKCECPAGISSTLSPEAANDDRAPVQKLYQGEWSSQIGSRMLLEAVGQYRGTRSGGMSLRPKSEGGSVTLPSDIYALYPSLIGVTLTNGGGVVPNGLRFHGPAGTFANGWIEAYSYRWAFSFVTGSHALKIGTSDTMGSLNDGPNLPTKDAIGRPLRYRFSRALTPDQVTFYHTPYKIKTVLDHDLGAFIQDRWTLHRLTLNAGVRYDWFVTSYPAQTLPASVFGRPELSFDAGKNLNWKDVTPRLGASYNLGGTGKTALKASLNKYVAGRALNGIASSANPISRLSGVDSGSRTWNDLDRDFFVDCDLIDRQPNGECPSLGPQINIVPSALTDLDVRTGWGVRGYNWELSAGVQREVLPRVSVDASYFRRWYGNFTVNDNLSVGSADFTRFDIMAPLDSRLPGGGGYIVPGYYDFTSADAATRASNNKTVLTDSIGKQIQHWNGIDVTVNARLGSGLTVMGGTSTGRDVSDTCEIDNALPENVGGNPFCRVVTPYLTQYKALAAYALPRFTTLPGALAGALQDVQISATFQNSPGASMAMTYSMPNAEIAQALNPATGVGSTLGRPLTNSTALTVNVIAPGTLYDERLNQLDMRVGRLVRVGKFRTALNVDLYNVLNTNTITSRNNSLGKSATPGSYAAAQMLQADGLYHSVWVPTGILQARFFKFSAQIDF